jgi:DNA modification methylase
VRLKQTSTTTAEISHRLSTNTLSNSKRIHRWGNFIAGFSVEFVELCLTNVSSDTETGIILDPFAGCGTTLVAAKNLGLNSVGYELHPVFHTIARSKLRHYNEDSANRAANLLRARRKPVSWSPDAEKFLAKLFSTRNLESARNAAGALEYSPPDLRDLSTTIFLKACELACGSQTDGIYKAPTTQKNHIPFDEALSRVEAEVTDDIRSKWYRHHWCATPASEIHRASALNMMAIAPHSVACCITSPPYLNNFDYAEMTRMHLYLLGWCSSWRNISEMVRNNLVTNTTTALNGKKTDDYQRAARGLLFPSLVTELESIVSDLAKERQNRAGKKEYDFLVYPYYSQIFNVLSSVFTSLRPGGKLHWVVADAALYGVHIETHEHTAEILRHLGYRNVKINFLRKRGHRWVLSKRDGAKKGLGEYHIEGEK